MIKKLAANFSLFILLIFVVVIAFKIGQWRTWRSEKTAETVFITDTLDYEYPDYVEKPSFTFRFTHTDIPLRSKQPVSYEPWMDSVHSALSIIVKKGTMDIIGKKGETAHNFILDDVPSDYELYGTEFGFKIIKYRFKNPFGWNGLLIGIEFYDLYREINPYIETGIKIKNIDITIGIDKNSLKEKIPIYADVSYKIL